MENKDEGIIDNLLRSKRADTKNQNDRNPQAAFNLFVQTWHHSTKESIEKILSYALVKLYGADLKVEYKGDDEDGTESTSNN